MMKRNGNPSQRPTPGCIPVPLFNQKKRNRIPLMSTPFKNDFSHSEFMPSTSSTAPYGASGGSYQAIGSSSEAHPGHQWNKQDTAQPTQSQHYGNYRPAPTMRSYAPVAHPYKAESTNSKMVTSSNPSRQQQPMSIFTMKQKQYQTPSSSQSVPSKQTPHSGFSQKGQQPSYRPVDSTQFRCLPPPVQPPTVPAAQTQNKWNFTNSFGSQKPTFSSKRSANKPQNPQEIRTMERAPKKAPFDYTLRILTAVIEGMRHWSQFKDKVTYFFEIFASLDSAVTLGPHGSKNFLLRDGKEVLQCVFYENEQELPRLIRGQVHRCVGNYDKRRDILVCVSVRAATLTEAKDAQEAIKASDSYMRKLVKCLHEV
ncbi:spermatogenesis-associated protein 22 [Corythoichthys intestinalis]|uniref:spermatogenesis-associated protein 22 n=1 Tax=Corythoichthys intestinalis TaxID=161448 RepID=UPI0025A4FFEF|nr:spermatogenesis-associated protein 22 [Corythoichthys intestinalis]XP_057676857.1 spermatogenesis-associated protein 22 [Corythoichthys intestinalis]XP_061801601.1 spermatogenesis-associated protein 22-like [Nerophis lumbriciformis]